MKKSQDAKIVDVNPYRIKKELEKEKIVIVAGFQGVSQKKEITTLGRGGSDTTAVALSIALGGNKVEFYKDVDAMYSHDPKREKKAKRYKRLSYENALRILDCFPKILHPRSVVLAQRNQILPALE